ncbi:MAG: VCBS repeat-containing protein [candidate division Zixibacteria bacterium]|nr:VCBS repeat-containing protein [candidate division Zixibacteria bacterium]
MKSFAKYQCLLITSLIAVIAVLFSSTKVQSIEDLFDKTILNVEGSYNGKLTEDINGDMLLDIIILRSKGVFPSVNKYASVFLQTTKGFRNEPDYSIRIPDELIFADISDVAGDINPELIVMGKGGVYFFRNNLGFLDTLAVNLIETETAITLPSPGVVMAYNFIRDVKGFENPIIVVPLPNEFGLFTGTPGMRYRSITKIRAQEKIWVQESEYGELPGNNHIHFGHMYPKITFADLNGDEIDDIFCTLENIVSIFYSTEEGTYLYEPDSEIDLKLLSPIEKESSSGHVSVVISDINNDEIPDISTTKLTGSITSYKGVLGIYFGGDQNFPSSPDYTMNTENAVFSGFLRDFNSDGKLDILVPELRLGLFGMIKLLLMKKLDMFLKIHLQTNKTFNIEPDYDKKITLEIDLSGDKIDLGTTIDFDGDINGDKLYDLVVNPGDNTLRIYLGSGTEVFGPEEFSRIQLDSPSHFEVLDLNGDKQGEIIATYENSPGYQGQIIILNLKPAAQLVTR